MSALSNLKKSISTFDAAWEESSHKRAANGQFGSGGSSSGKGGKAAPAKKKDLKQKGAETSAAAWKASSSVTGSEKKSPEAEKAHKNAAEFHKNAAENGLSKNKAYHQFQQKSHETAAKVHGEESLGKGSRYGMTAQQNSNPKHQMARNGGMLHGNPAKHKEQAAELLKEHNEMQKSLERIKGKGNISEEQLLGSAIKARKQAIEAHNKAAIR